MGIARHLLDYNRYYSLVLDYNNKNQQLKVTMTDDGQPWPRFVDNVLGQLRVTDPSVRQTRHERTITFKPVRREFTLAMGDEAIGTYTIERSGNLSQTFRRPLTVDETRRIGTFYKCPPYPQRREGLSYEANQALLAEANTVVYTDIHTHSTGQISAHGLLKAAMQQKPYYYPVSLLKEAGIRTDYDAIPAKSRKMINRVPFPPMEKQGVEYPKEVEGADLNKLSTADRAKLAARMALPADRQSTFKHLEYDGNRFRYPLSKDKSLTRAIREQEAEEYIAQGVQFALSSFVGIDDPYIFRTLHEVAIEAEANFEKTGFAQRFMVGIPRGVPPEKMKEMFERAKILLDSPYIVGIDILGYEANKTKQFVELLDEFCAWANANKPGCFVRVHAGENDKNHDNVKDFLKIAVKYPNLNYLVGHGVYGMDEETTKLAKRLSRPGHRQLTLEFNPSSNVALNNINDVRQIPFAAAIENDLPFVLSSDAAGMYHTDPTQLGLAAFYAGVEARGFAMLRKNQDHIIQQMHSYSRAVADAIPGWNTGTQEQRIAHVETMLDRLAKVPKAVITPVVKPSREVFAEKLRKDHVSLVEFGEPMPAELADKSPITILGASGATWKRMTRAQQHENAVAIDMLIHAINGNSCYVTEGRTKKDGLCKVIHQSRRDADEQARRTGGGSELFHAGLQIDPNFEDTTSYKHFSHIIHVPGQQLDLADAVVKHTFDNNGVLIAVNGAAYTADIILTADQQGIHDKDPKNRKMMLLLGNAGGASGDKAQLLHPDYRAMDGRQLLKKLYAVRPELFAVDFELSTLNERYKESAARVATYGYNHADTAVRDVHHVARVVLPVAHKDEGRGHS